MTVYIVDDSRDIRARLKEILTELSEVHTIEEAESLQEVQENIDRIDPDILIVDIRLKEGSGFLVLEYICRYFKVPMIVVLTNYPTEEYRKKCIRLGADYFFNKSTEFEKAVYVIENFVTDEFKIKVNQ